MGEIDQARTRLSWGLRRELSYVEGATVMGEARENQRARILATRIDNGYWLTAGAGSRTASLNYGFAQQNQNRPDLQAEQALLEETCVLGCQGVIHGYMNRR